MKELLRFIEATKFVQLELVDSSYTGNRQYPLDGRLVFQAFRGRSGVLKGKTGIFSHSRFVKIKYPDTIGEIVFLLAGLANLECDKMGYEYALEFYISEDGKPYFFVQNGKNWFAPSVQPHNLLMTPEGTRLILWGVLGHTHPFGAPDPSEGDKIAIRGGFGQNDFFPVKLQYSILVVPGGAWSFFNKAGEVFRGNEAVAKRKMTGLFGN